jgi:predicted RNase H-like nuclease
VLQHLLLGMNAHISLDLGVAAAEVCPGRALPALRGDFDEINRLLGEMVDEVQARIARISPWMWVIDHVGLRTDEALCGFCMERARDLAWRAAERLAPLAAADRAQEIDRIDALACMLSGPIGSPGPIASTVLLVPRLREAGDVGRIIDALDGRRAA